MVDSLLGGEQDILEAITPKVGGPRGIIRNYKIRIANGTTYVKFEFARPCIVRAIDPVSAGRLYFIPEQPPVDDDEADRSDSGEFFAFASGVWWIRHSGSSAQTFRVSDAGGSGQASAALAGASPLGPISTAPLTWGSATAVTVNAASTTVLAANVNRRGFSLFNASTGGQRIAVGVTDPMTGVLGIWNLDPGVGTVQGPVDGVTTQKLLGYGSAAGGSIIVAEAT